MGDWICDANISQVTVDELKKAGIEADHIVADYGITGSKEDDEIISLAKNENKTLITGDYRDFDKKNNVVYVNTPGIWILKTSDPVKQAKLIKTLRDKEKLNTRASRKNKKVFFRGDDIAEITEVKSNKKKLVVIKLSSKNKK